MPPIRPGDVHFAQLVRPPSMRSIYWRYFGFPAKASGEIITRHKIVCTLCNAALAYNRNTTNLKVHLRNRHSDVFEANTGDEQMRQLDTSVRYIFQPAIADSSDGDGKSGELEQEPSQSGEESDGGDELGEFVVFGEEEEVQDAALVAMEADEEPDEKHIGDEELAKQCDAVELELVADIESGEIFEDLKNKGYTIEYVVSPDQADPVEQNAAAPAAAEAAEVAHSPEESPALPAAITPPDTLLLQAIIENALPTNLAASASFAAFCTSLNPDYRLPPAQQLTEAAHDRYTREHAATIEKLLSDLSATSTDPQFFSIGLDRWSNHRGTQFITVYIFHVATDDGQPQSPHLATTQLATISWDGAQKQNTSDWQLVFRAFPMWRCSAAVLNFSTTELSSFVEFAEKTGFDTIVCLQHAISEAARQCLATMDVRGLFQALDETTRELVPETTLQLPAIDPHCWQSQLEQLAVAERLGEQLPLAAEARQLLGAIRDLVEPLRVALQTIEAERTASASLVHPIVQQLLQRHFASAGDEKDADPSESPPTSPVQSSSANIKQLVHRQFAQFRLSYHPLSMAASLLDPRFQNLIDAGELPALRLRLRQFSEADSTGRDAMPTGAEPPQRRTDAPPETSKLSGFLQLRRKSDATAVTRRSRLDVQLDAYVAEVDAELEQCPLAWWRRPDALAVYGQLERCARRFLCVPAVLPRARMTVADGQGAAAVERMRAGLVGQVEESISYISLDIYCQQLDRLKAALMQKSPSLINRGRIVFHQDNAKPDTSLVTRQKLRELEPLTK